MLFLCFLLLPYSLRFFLSSFCLFIFLPAFMLSHFFLNSHCVFQGVQRSDLSHKLTPVSKVYKLCFLYRLFFSKWAANRCSYTNCKADNLLTLRKVLAVPPHTSVTSSQSLGISSIFTSATQVDLHAIHHLVHPSALLKSTQSVIIPFSVLLQRLQRQVFYVKQ